VERAFTTTSRLLAILLMVVGLAMVVTTLARGGGPFAIGVVFGAIFAVLGALRLRLAGAVARPRER